MKIFVVELHSNGTIKTEHCDTKNAREYKKFVDRYSMSYDIFTKLSSGEVVHIKDISNDSGGVFNLTFIQMPEGQAVE